MAWRDWGHVYPAASGLTLVSMDRCRVIWGLAHATAHLRGQAAEVGVYKGGTLMLIAAADPTRTVHAFDTFTGIPATNNPTDGHKPGDFTDTSLGAVRTALAGYPNIDFYPGYFPKTRPRSLLHRYTFVHFDGDLYQSCKDTIAYFWPRMIPGGVMVFDDFGWPSCPGVGQAIADAGLTVGCITAYQAVAVKGA